MNWDISNVLWFLGAAAFCFWMMRKGGCGMHSSRSRASGSHQHGEAGDGAHSSTIKTVRDPVCGMQIDPEHAAGIRTVQGLNFFFCSSSCLEKFDQDPQRYNQANESVAASVSKGHACC
ncbi:MAG TPA: YHS domain-containing protein [Polyangiaceae bacterium]|jgi:YHS domain-containing protein|nr:YHS domain-containing protein [Polyangiaceae bacterium]